MALEPAKLSDFKVAGALGSGTTARVYEAVHTATGRHVAIKMLEPSQAGSESRERFAREAILLAGVTSRHVGTILGFGFDRGQPFLVLERLHGETLDAKLRRDGPIPIPTAARWIEQLIVGVRDCHDALVIHRDIKPSNIFLHEDGFDQTVKLIDFGVARLREIAGNTGLTSSHHLIGSMGYMAPEQLHDAKAVGFTADLYAIGIVIFRTLTGRLPFVSRSLEAAIRMKAQSTVPVISTMPGVPKHALLDWFVAKSVSRDPRERFQTAREMLEHWWNVMAALDQESATEVMRGIGRVDESYAGPVPRTPLDANDTIEDDRTIRRLPRQEVRQDADVEATTISRNVGDIAPSTVPLPSTAVVTPARAAPSTAPRKDPFDLPTRSDPALRQLVERELELHRKREGRR